MTPWRFATWRPPLLRRFKAVNLNETTNRTNDTNRLFLHWCHSCDPWFSCRQSGRSRGNICLVSGPPRNEKCQFGNGTMSHQLLPSCLAKNASLGNPARFDSSVHVRVVSRLVERRLATPHSEPLVRAFLPTEGVLG